MTNHEFVHTDCNHQRSFVIRASSFLRHWVLRHSSLILATVMAPSMIHAQAVPSKEPSSTHVFPAGGRRGTVVPVRIGTEAMPPSANLRLWGDGVRAAELLGERSKSRYEPSARRPPRDADGVGACLGISAGGLATRKADRQTLLGVYRDAYALRLIEVLTNDYPGLLAMTGPADFDRMARAYIAAHPSHHPSVRWFGARLADFLAGTAPYSGLAAAAEMAPRRPRNRT